MIFDSLSPSAYTILLVAVILAMIICLVIYRNKLSKSLLVACIMIIIADAILLVIKLNLLNGIKHILQIFFYLFLVAGIVIIIKSGRRYHDKNDHTLKR